MAHYVNFPMTLLGWGPSYASFWLCVLWHVTHLAMLHFSHLWDRNEYGTHLTGLKWRLSE